MQCKTFLSIVTALPVSIALNMLGFPLGDACDCDPGRLDGHHVEGPHPRGEPAQQGVDTAFTNVTFTNSGSCIHSQNCSEHQALMCRQVCNAVRPYDAGSCCGVSFRATACPLAGSNFWACLLDCRSSARWSRSSRASIPASMARTAQSGRPFSSTSSRTSCMIREGRAAAARRQPQAGGRQLQKPHRQRSRQVQRTFLLSLDLPPYLHGC